MSNGTGKSTFRRNLHGQNITNDLTLAPPPFLPGSIASNSTNNIEHGPTNTSQEQKKKQQKKKKIDELEDQVVPRAKHGTKHPVIEHNGFDDYYRSRLDAPIFRYNSSNNNEDRQTFETNSIGTQDNPIVIE